MKEIKLTQGQIALVDDEDFEFLNRFKWNSQLDNKSGDYYAKTGEGWLMHRMIMGCSSSGLVVDHKNRNTLDNQKSNLRIATLSQSAMNRGVRSDSMIEYKGVSEHNCRFIARIMVNGNRIYLGKFKLPSEAARAYDKAAKEYFGEYAALNFPHE